MIIEINDNRDHLYKYTLTCFSSFSSIVCEVNTTVFFFYKYHKRLKRI